MLRTFATIAAVVLFNAVALADDKSAKIVGTWELTKTERLDSGASFIIKFAKDGTATSSYGVPKMKQVAGHTWKIDGDKMIIISKDDTAFKFETGTITALTDKKLTLKMKGGFEEEYTRLK